MEIAVTLPDALFEEADRVASQLGLSRSELYAHAIAALVRAHAGESITETIDRAVRTAEAAGDTDLARIQSRSLGPDEGDFDTWVASTPRA